MTQLPERPFTCPHCTAPVTLARGTVAADCPGCGELIFRPLPRENVQNSKKDV